jgi:hypothetical protein
VPEEATQELVQHHPPAWNRVSPSAGDRHRPHSARPSPRALIDCLGAIHQAQPMRREPPPRGPVAASIRPDGSRLNNRLVRQPGLRVESPAGARRRRGSDTRKPER